MEQVKSCICTHKALSITMIVCILFCVFMSSYVVMTFEPVINYQKNFSHTEKYPWEIYRSENTLKLGDYSFSTNWDIGDDVFFVQLFDGAFVEPPTEKYREVSRIPENAKKMQFDFTLSCPESLDLNCYLMQYDSFNRLESALKIEKLNTSILSKNPYNILTQCFSVKTNIQSSAVYYKILFQVNPTEVAGELTVDNINIQFN